MIDRIDRLQVEYIDSSSLISQAKWMFSIESNFLESLGEVDPYLGVPLFNINDVPNQLTSNLKKFAYNYTIADDFEPKPHSDHSYCPNHLIRWTESIGLKYYHKD